MAGEKIGTFGRGDVWATRNGDEVLLKGGPYDGCTTKFIPSKYLHTFCTELSGPDAAYKWDLEFTTDYPPRIVVRTASFLGYCDKYGEPLPENAQAPTVDQCELIGEEPPRCADCEAKVDHEHHANPGGDLDPNG